MSGFCPILASNEQEKWFLVCRKIELFSLPFPSSTCIQCACFYNMCTLIVLTKRRPKNDSSRKWEYFLKCYIFLLKKRIIAKPASEEVSYKHYLSLPPPTPASASHSKADPSTKPYFSFQKNLGIILAVSNSLKITFPLKKNSKTQTPSTFYSRMNLLCLPCML